MMGVRSFVDRLKTSAAQFTGLRGTAATDRAELSCRTITPP
jgi:hypothetical protein